MNQRGNVIYDVFHDAMIFPDQRLAKFRDETVYAMRKKEKSGRRGDLENAVVLAG